MTQFSKTVFIGDLLLSSIYTYADESTRDYTLTIATGDQKVINFTLDAAESSSFNIYDENRNLIYSRESETNKLEISTTISLEGSSSDFYFLEIIENGKVMTHKIEVTAKKITAKAVIESLSLQD